MSEALVAFLGSAVLAAVFLLPVPRDVVSERTPGFRAFVSFAAGISIAYVFIDLLPELAEAGEHVSEHLVLTAALAGFVVFYGLERLVRWAGAEPPGPSVGPVPGPIAADEAGLTAASKAAHEAAEIDERTDYAIKLAGLSAYAGLVVYLMVTAFRGGSEDALLLYLVAMVFHFLAMRHSLRFEHPDAYDRRGRFVLAGACLAGWAVGWFFQVPGTVEALLLGFLGGMLIMNTTVMELPSEKEGRFGAFALGAFLYAGLLLAI